MLTTSQALEWLVNNQEEITKLSSEVQSLNNTINLLAAIFMGIIGLMATFIMYLNFDGRGLKRRIKRTEKELNYELEKVKLISYLQGKSIQNLNISSDYLERLSEIVYSNMKKYDVDLLYFNFEQLWESYLKLYSSSKISKKTIKYMKKICIEIDIQEDELEEIERNEYRSKRLKFAENTNDFEFIKKLYIEKKFSSENIDYTVIKCIIEADKMDNEKELLNIAIENALKKVKIVIFEKNIKEILKSIKFEDEDKRTQVESIIIDRAKQIE